MNYEKFIALSVKRSNGERRVAKQRISIEHQCRARCLLPSSARFGIRP
jgi:hypothetical protein